jgi:exosortase A
MSTTASIYNWRIAILFVSILMVSVLGGYQQTVLYLAKLWGNISEGEYAHGYLVLAISGYLVYLNRHKLERLAPCPEYRVLPLLGLAVSFWVIAAYVDVLAAQAAGLLLIVLTAIWVMLGTKAMHVLFFPILFIGFALPVWFPISPLLQDMTADVVFYFIRAINVPAFRHENMIVLSAGTLSIEEACSGLRYLMAALTLGTLYAYLNYQGLYARISVVAVAVLAAVLSNFLRVFIVVYLGYRSDMQHPLVHDHLMLGWYLFGGIVVLLLFIDNRLASIIPTQHNNSSMAISQKPEQEYCRKGAAHFVIILFIATGLVLAGPAIINHVTKQNKVSSENITVFKIMLPETIGQWKKNIFIHDSWQPVYHGAKTVKQVFEKNGQQVTLYIGYYEKQKQGEELIYDLNNITNRSIWRPQYTRDRLLSTGNLNVREQLLEKNTREQKLVWYYYQMAGEYTVNRYIAKILQIVGLLTGKPDAYVMAVATNTHDDTETARKVLADFYLAVQTLLDNGGTLLHIVKESDHLDKS